MIDIEWLYHILASKNSSNGSYIKHIVTLTHTQGFNGHSTVRVAGSYSIQQTAETPASDLHYRIGTDMDILTYLTQIDRLGTPTIIEADPRRELTVDWVFSDAVPWGEWVVIYTEFVEKLRNSNSYYDWIYRRQPALHSQLWLPQER